MWNCPWRNLVGSPRAALVPQRPLDPRFSSGSTAAAVTAFTPGTDPTRSRINAVFATRLLRAKLHEGRVRDRLRANEPRERRLAKAEILEKRRLLGRVESRDLDLDTGRQHEAGSVQRFDPIRAARSLGSGADARASSRLTATSSALSLRNPYPLSRPRSNSASGTLRNGRPSSSTCFINSKGASSFGGACSLCARCRRRSTISRSSSSPSPYGVRIFAKC
jgi:hypothetical protein